MEYKIKTTEAIIVQAEEYIAAATKMVMDGLEMLEAVSNTLDDDKIVSPMSEIAEYVESIQETIGDLEPKEDDSPYAERTVEENDEHKTLRAKFLNRS